MLSRTGPSHGGTALGPATKTLRRATAQLTRPTAGCRHRPAPRRARPLGEGAGPWGSGANPTRWGGDLLCMVEVCSHACGVMLAILGPYRTPTTFHVCLQTEDGRATNWGVVDPNLLFNPEHGWCMAEKPKASCGCTVDGELGPAIVLCCSASGLHTAAIPQCSVLTVTCPHVCCRHGR